MSITNFAIGNGNVQINKLETKPDYESLRKSVKGELKEVYKLNAEALNILTPAQTLQKIIQAIFLSWLPLGWFLNWGSKHFSFLHATNDLYLKFLFVSFTISLALAFLRSIFMRNYVSFLKESYYRVNAVESRLNNLYAIVCQHFGDTSLVAELQKGIDLIHAFKENYRNFIGSKQGRKLRLSC